MKAIVADLGNDDGRSFVPFGVNSLLSPPVPGQYVQNTPLPSGFGATFDPNWVAPQYVPSPLVSVAPAPVVQSAPVLTADEFRNRQRYAESAFNNSAVSGAGAKGAFQIMPSVLSDYVASGGKEGDLFDYEYNRSVRDWYVDWLLKRAAVNGNGNEQSDAVKWAKLAAAYNWGVGNLGKYLQKQKENGVDIYNSTDWVEGLNPETRDYVKFVALQQDTSKTRSNEAYRKALENAKVMAMGGTMKKLSSAYAGDAAKMLEVVRKFKKEGNLYYDGDDKEGETAPRDNTATRFSPSIYNGPQRHFVHNVSVDVTDSPMGYAPIIGDALQAGQVIMDLGDRNFKRAALNAGLLFVPNLLEKPIKAGVRVLKNAAKKASVSANLTSRVKAALDKIPEIPRDGRFLERIGHSSDLRDYLIKEGVDPDILTDDALRKLTFGRFSALSSASDGMPGRFAARMPLKDGLDGYWERPYMIMQPGYPKVGQYYPAGVVGEIHSSSLDPGLGLNTDDVGVGIVKNITEYSDAPQHGISRFGYDAVIQDNGNVVSGVNLLKPDVTTHVWEKYYPDREIVGNFGRWNASGFSDGNPVVRLTKQSQDVPMKYVDTFSASSIAPDGTFIIDFTKDPFHASGGPLLKPYNRSKRDDQLPKNDKITSLAQRIQSTSNVSHILDLLKSRQK